MCELKKISWSENERGQLCGRAAKMGGDGYHENVYRVYSQSMHGDFFQTREPTVWAEMDERC